MYYKSDRGNLYFNLMGEGKETFVLLHNAGGNSNFFTHQVNALKQHGKILMIDFLGHGKSDKPDQAYDLEQNAKDVVALCKSINIHQFILVGLNYGADVGIEMATITEDMKAMVLIDPPICMNKKVVGLVQGHIDHLNDDKKPHNPKELVNDSFLHTNDENRLIGEESFTTIPRQSLASLYEHLIQWDKKSSEKLKSIQIPMLCILTDAALCSADEIKKHNKAIKFGKVVDSLYWATLEVPDQVNAMIIRFLTVINKHASVT